MIRIELKKCPFCGGDAELSFEKKELVDLTTYVKCKACGAQGESFTEDSKDHGRGYSLLYAIEAAEKAWDTRSDIWEEP